MKEYVLQYSESVYEAKISRLEELSKRMLERKAKIESLRDQITSAWDDDSGRQYYNSITEHMILCEKAQEKIENARKNFTSVKENIERVKTTVNDSLDNTTSTVKTATDIIGALK